MAKDKPNTSPPDPTKPAAPAPEFDEAQTKLIAAAGERAVEAAKEAAAAPRGKPVGADELKELRAKAEAEKRGKLRARRMLLEKTRMIVLIRDTPTSKGDLKQGMPVRLPHAECDSLIGHRRAKEMPS